MHVQKPDLRFNLLNQSVRFVLGSPARAASPPQYKFSASPQQPPIGSLAFERDFLLRAACTIGTVS
jgi:hypothetical protein